MANYKTSWVQRLIDGVWTKTFAFAHAKTVYTDYENKKTLDKSLEEVQKRISDNGYGEVAGGKNLFFYNDNVEFEENSNKYQSFTFDSKTDNSVRCYVPNSGSYTGAKLNIYGLKPSTKYSASCSVTENTSKFNPRIYCTESDSNGTLVVNLSLNNGATLSESGYYVTFSNIQIEEGTTATSYEPYFPSNKMLMEEKADKTETTVNLLKANQPATVTSGVTKTNNEDGTYTIQGTASQVVYTNVGRVDNFETGVYKLTGTKVTSGNVFLYVNGVKKDGSSDYSILTENTKPISLIDKSVYTYLIIGVAVANGVTVNETIRPMLTTNLQATYDDFVPYTGDTGSLNGDVADLRGNVDGMLMSAEVRKVYYNLAGSSFDSETAGKTMIAKVNFANFKNKSMIASGDFIINSLPFNTAKKGDYLEVRLSKSDYPDLASKMDSGIKKLAFGISGDFSSKVVGHVNCGLQDDYIRIWLTFNDAYNFNTSTLQSGIADIFF